MYSIGYEVTYVGNSQKLLCVEQYLHRVDLSLKLVYDRLLALFERWETILEST